jgi:hypothetical protein
MTVSRSRGKDRSVNISWWLMELEQAEKKVLLIASILKKIKHARLSDDIPDEVPLSLKPHLRQAMAGKLTKGKKPPEIMPAREKKKKSIKKNPAKNETDKRKKIPETGKPLIRLNLTRGLSKRSKNVVEEEFYLLADHRATE